MSELKIGNVTLKNNLLLAPIAGYSDVGFRKVCKKYGAALTCTEMISVKALLFGNKKTFDLLATFEGEKPCAVQLFGSNPKDFEKVLKLGILDKFDIIDINMGCPAPKIFQNGDGSALLGDIKKAGDIVRACVRATSKPITVKFRSGIDSDHIVAVEFAKELESAGASMLTIHARTRQQGYSGRADLLVAKAVKDAVNIPVVVSGDCVDKKSYISILEKTGADGVMIARGALGRPEVFAEILDEDVRVDKLSDIMEHIKELQKHFDDRYIVLTMRSHIAFYLKRAKVSVSERLALMKEENLQNVVKMLRGLL